jgi:hypothetical protein
MKHLLFKLFNSTFGTIIRVIQKSLVATPFIGVHYYLKQQAAQKSAEYAINNFSHAMIFQTKEHLWDYCIQLIPSFQVVEKVIIAEFGVYKGHSINYFAKKCPNALLFGFDSFEGLEEDWYGFILQKGEFHTNSELPKCEKNVELFKGWFEQTVPSFIEKLQQDQIQILHMDADTYNPTAFVLNSLYKNLGKGSIVIFDEYLGYPSWELHEFRAWQELVDSTGIKYQYIAHSETPSNGFSTIQVAVKVL